MFARVNKSCDKLVKKSKNTRLVDFSVTTSKSLTRVTVGPTVAKIADTDAVSPQRLTISIIIAVWTRIVFKLAS